MCTTEYYIDIAIHIYLTFFLQINQVDSTLFLGIVKLVKMNTKQGFLKAYGFQ